MREKGCYIILIGGAQILSFNVFWIIYEPKGRFGAILPALPLHSLIDLDKYKQRPPQCTRGHQTAAMSGIHSRLHEFLHSGCRWRRMWISMLKEKEIVTCWLAWMWWCEYILFKMIRGDFHFSINVNHGPSFILKDYFGYLNRHEGDWQRINASFWNFRQPTLLLCFPVMLLW